MLSPIKKVAAKSIIKAVNQSASINNTNRISIHKKKKNFSVASIKSELEFIRKNNFILFNMNEIQKRNFLEYYGNEMNPFFIVEKKGDKLVSTEVALETEIRRYLTLPDFSRSSFKVDYVGYGHSYVICLRKLKYYHSQKQTKRLLNNAKQAASSTSLKLPTSKRLITRLYLSEIPSINLSIYEVTSALKSSLTYTNDLI